MVIAQTSRQRIFDAIEACTNQIQLASHLQELIDFDMSDLEIEEDSYRRSEILKKIQHNNFILQHAISLRRDIMSHIQDKFEEYNSDYWCAFKHALASRGYTQEVLYAAHDTQAEDNYKRAKEQLMMILSKFLGMEITKCGRCIDDHLSHKVTPHDVRTLSEENKHATTTDAMTDTTSHDTGETISSNV